MKRDSAEKHQIAIRGDSNKYPISSSVQSAALGYVRKLRQADPQQYERPQVTLIGKNAEECPSNENIENAARVQLTNARRADETRRKSASIGTVQVQPPVKALSADFSPTKPSLPPRDSPLTKVFLGQYLSLLVQETITIRKTQYSELARKMSIPEMVLQDAIHGKLGLTRRQWIKFAGVLSLSTTFELRPSERDGTSCWELCYPAIRVGTPMQW